MSPCKGFGMEWHSNENAPVMQMDARSLTERWFLLLNAQARRESQTCPQGEPKVTPWGQREGKPGSWLPLWPFRPSQEAVQRWNFKRHSNLSVYVPFNDLLFLMLMLNVYVFNFVANVNRMYPVCFSYFYSFWEGAGFHGRLLLVMQLKGLQTEDCVLVTILLLNKKLFFFWWLYVPHVKHYKDMLDKIIAKFPSSVMNLASSSYLKEEKKKNKESIVQFYMKRFLCVSPWSHLTFRRF